MKADERRSRRSAKEGAGDTGMYDEYCREKVAVPGSSYYYSTLFVAPERQKALNVVYAFKAEIEGIRRSCSDPGIARIKLEWWRDELQRALEGAPQHPVAQGIAMLITQYGLMPPDLLAIIDCAERRLNGERYPSYAALKEDHRHSAGALARLACTITGCESEETSLALPDLYAALEMAHSVQNLREEATRGWIPLPTDEMEQLGVSPWDLLSHPSTPQLLALIARHLARLGEDLSSALTRLPACDRIRQLHAIIMGELMRATLHEVQRDGCRVLDHRTTLTPLRKLWIAWRTQRKESKRYRNYRRCEGVLQ